MSANKYTTIAASGTGDFRDRGSKFLAFSYPIASVADVKDKLQTLKKEHPKANHHCYAYRLGTDGNEFRANDDGEPSGSAGKPILGQIDSMELTNVLVVVVRYFGGTLLGVPGLINAYKSAAALALQTTPLVQRQVEQELMVQFDYTQLNEIMRVVKQYNGRVVRQEMQLFCSMTVAVPRNRFTEISYILKELRNVEVSAVRAAG